MSAMRECVCAYSGACAVCNGTQVPETGFVRITDLVPAIDAFNAACEAARECSTSETRRQVDRTCFALLLELQSAGMSNAYWDFVSLDRGIVRFSGALVPRNDVASASEQ